MMALITLPVALATFIAVPVFVLPRADAWLDELSRAVSNTKKG